MIWLWRNPNTLAQTRMGEYIKDSGTDAYDLIDGIVIEPSKVDAPKVVFRCDEKYLTDVLPNSVSLLIVSEKVLAILKEMCPVDFQSFDANIYVKEKKIDGYYLLNVTNKVEIIDKTKSIFTLMKHSNTILRFEKIVYKVDELIDHDIVRNADYLPHVLVSDRLKEAFKRAKIKGVEFRQEP
jgi:hypothetical protein